MKILLILLVTGIFFVGIIPHDTFAQSSSTSNNCPQGTKAEVQGLNIVCVPISTVEKKCPNGSYQGKDNQGNFACRDIETNNIVDPKTGLMYDPHTGQLIQKEKPTTNSNQNTSGSMGNLPEFVPYAIVGIIILAIAVTALQKRGSYVGGSWTNPPSMKQLAILRNYGFDGQMPTSSREAWMIIDDLKRGGDGILEDDEDDYR